MRAAPPHDEGHVGHVAVRGWWAGESVSALRAPHRLCRARHDARGIGNQPLGTATVSTYHPRRPAGSRRSNRKGKHEKNENHGRVRNASEMRRVYPTGLSYYTVLKLPSASPALSSRDHKVRSELSSLYLPLLPPRPRPPRLVGGDKRNSKGKASHQRTVRTNGQRRSAASGECA